MSKKSKQLHPWSFVPANENTRGNGVIGAGDYRGTGVKAKYAKIKSFSNLRPPQDLTEGFKKPITLA